MSAARQPYEEPTAPGTDLDHDHVPGLGDAPEPAEETIEAPWLRLRWDGLKVTALYMVGVAILAGVPVATGIASGAGWLISLAFVIGGAAVVIAAVVALDALRIKFTRYRVTDSRVEMADGIVFKQRRSLARERVRSVDVSANLVQRWFGLAKVKIGTGESGGGPGTNKESLSFDAVGQAEADRLRAELLRRTAVETGPDGERRLATWRLQWLRYAPLAWVTPAMSAAVIGASFQVADWFGRGGLPVRITRDLVDDYGPWPVLGMGLAALLVVGALVSLGFATEAWWQHRLDREPGGTLRVRRGLFVNRSLSLEEERIRGVEIVEPLGARLAGAARLDVVAIGLKTNAEASDLSTLIPASPKAVAERTAERVIGSVETELTGHPVAARTRRLRWAVMYTIALAALAGGLLLLWAPSGFWSAVIVLAAVLAAAFGFWTAVDAYRSLGHGINRGYLVSRRGSVRRSTVHLDRSGIVGWRLRQSIFQRRLGLMSLDAPTAAGDGHYVVVDADPGEILDFAEENVPDLLRPFLVHEGGQPR